MCFCDLASLKDSCLVTFVYNQYFVTNLISNFQSTEYMSTIFADCTVPIHVAETVANFHDTPNDNATPQLMSTLESCMRHDTLNLRQSMFHIFISYRACGMDMTLVRALHSSFMATLLPKKGKRNRTAEPSPSLLRLPLTLATVYSRSSRL